MSGAGVAPFNTLETPRLVLRRMEADDWPSVHRYMSDPVVTTWLPAGLMDEAQSQAFVAKHTGDEPTALAVISRASGDLIGHMDFHPWFAPRTHEIGWALGREHQGRGYATEAAKALLADAFERLACHRVIATCQPQNAPSWRVMEKLGMRREADFRQCIDRGDGVWWDEYLYAMLAEEYFAGRGAAAASSGRREPR